MATLLKSCFNNIIHFSLRVAKVSCLETKISFKKISSLRTKNPNSVPLLQLIAYQISHRVGQGCHKRREKLLVFPTGGNNAIYSGKYMPKRG